MDARPILIQGMNFAPEPIGIGRYTGELATYLTAQGRDVDIVTTPPHYPGWKFRNPKIGNRYGRQVIGRLTVLRCPLLLHRSGFGIWRLLAPLSFAVSAAPVIFWRIVWSRPAAVLCVEPTLFAAPVALLAAKIVGSRCLLHVQDLEVDAAFDVGHIRSGWLRRLGVWLERTLMRRFDLVVTISDRMRQKLISKGLAGSRVAVVRNWVDTSKISYRPESNRFRGQLRIAESDFVVLYSGQMGPKQALGVLLDAAEKCEDDPTIKFVVAGEGPVKDKLIRRYGHLNNLTFLQLQPEDLLPELLNIADLHVITQDRNAADLVLPSKLGGMLASGRSILVTAETGTELATLLEGAAYITPPGDATALAVAIKQACAKRDPLPRPYETLLAQFSSAAILPRFYDLICGETPAPNNGGRSGKVPARLLRLCRRSSRAR